MTRSRNFTDQVGYGPDETFGWALFLGLMIVVCGALAVPS